MDDIKRIDLVDIDLNSGNLHRSWVKHSIGKSDIKANAFGVRVYRDGEMVNLEGGSIQGHFLDSQGNKIAITDNSFQYISGNVAHITLPQACYNNEGQFTLAIKLINSGLGITGTVRIVDGMVDNTNTGGEVAPTGSVPTYEQFLDVYEEMVDMIEEAETFLDGAVAPQYDATATYNVGEYVIHNGSLYRCKTTISTAEAWTSGHWTACPNGVAGQLKAVIGEIAPEYDPDGGIYELGDYVSYDRKFYRCKVTLTDDPPTTAASWQQVDIANELAGKITAEMEARESDVSNLKSALNFTDLINGLAFIANTAIDDAGNEWTGRTGRYCTEYIPCGANLEVKYVGETNHSSIGGIAFYDINKRVLSVYSNNGTKGTEITVTSPANTAYCRLSTDAGTLANSYVKVPNGSLSDTFDSLIDAQPQIVGGVMQDNLLNTTSQNIITSDVINESGLTIAGKVYTISAGGYLFAVPKLYGTFSKKVTVQFMIVSGSGYTARYIAPFDPSTGVGTQKNFSQRTDSYGNTIYYAEFTPSDTTSEKPYVQIRIDNRSGSAPLVIRNLVAYADATYINFGGEDVAYISPDGNDSTGDGSYTSPYATVNKALSIGVSKVMCLAGKYFQTIDLANAKKSHITIASYTKTGRAIFIHPDAFVSDSENTTEYDGVFSVPYTNTIRDEIRLYQDGVPDAATLISDAERNPYQRGQAYRCLDTKIMQCDATTLADAITEIMNSDWYKYFHDTENGVLYFSRPQAITASNPLMRSVHMAEFFANADRNIELSLYGIEAKYMRFNVSGSIAHLEDCKSTNSFGAGGFVYDNCLSTEFVRCESSGTHYAGGAGDGFNGHGDTSGDSLAKKVTVRLVDCWSHDSNDDGYSDHECSEIEIWGGLFEYNGKAGVTPSYGSHCACYNVISRNNYSGFLYLGEATQAEGGKYGQLFCMMCVAENNTDNTSGYGFGVQSSGNLARLINCKSIGNLVGYYHATGATMELTDCGALNNTTIETGGGTLTVKNTMLVSQ